MHFPVGQLCKTIRKSSPGFPSFWESSFFLFFFPWLPTFSTLLTRFMTIKELPKSTLVKEKSKNVNFFQFFSGTVLIFHDLIFMTSIYATFCFQPWAINTWWWSKPRKKLIHYRKENWNGKQNTVHFGSAEDDALFELSSSFCSISESSESIFLSAAKELYFAS